MTLIHVIKISQTASSGAWSFNTVKIEGGILSQIIVKALSADTTFDFTITDNEDVIVYDTAERGLSATGTLNDDVNIPFKGTYTLAVSGASADEAFTGKLMVLD